MSIVEAQPTELRQRMRYAPVAVLAGLLLLASAVIQLGGAHARVNEVTIGLITVSKRGSIDIIGAIINAVALLLIAATLNFLYELVRVRQPAVGQYIRVLAVVGGLVTGVLGVAYAIVVHVKAHQFVTQGTQTYPEANRLTHSFAFTVLPTIELAGALALAIAFLLLALAAMRVGLLTRFMGYLGILTGVLVLIPIGTPVPVVEAFWLIGLGVLFAGRWPNGMPRSWETGKAEPWPSSQEQRVRAAGARGKPAPAAASSGGKGAVASPAQPTTNSRSAQKRKRKRRR